MLSNLYQAGISLGELNCLALLAQGQDSRRSLAQSLIVPPSAVDTLLCRMRKKQLIERMAPGHWRPSPAGWMKLEQIRQFLGSALTIQEHAPFE